MWMVNDSGTMFNSVRRMQSKGIMLQIFPLHVKEDLKRLSLSWYQRVKLSYQPLGKCQRVPILYAEHTLLCPYMSFVL